MPTTATTNQGQETEAEPTARAGFNAPEPEGAPCSGGAFMPPASRSPVRLFRLTAIAHLTLVSPRRSAPRPTVRGRVPARLPPTAGRPSRKASPGTPPKFARAPAIGWVYFVACRTSSGDPRWGIAQLGDERSDSLESRRTNAER